ncbi:MAG: ornithine cyclodeaminase family protein [Candidatus Omnitrophica bacterium]|nr:ornithine cyclodeaminase family protein [Candidatus Omnitrophota bacterium]
MATLSTSASAKRPRSSRRRGSPEARGTTVLLTQADIARLVDMRTAIRVVARAFEAQAKGQTRMPPKLYLHVPKGDFRAMPAYLADPSACGIKWVNVHPDNPAHGLPTVMATIVLNNPATAVPLAIMDGLLITKLRTAAASAVAAKALARRNSRTVGLVGCGAQALSQVEALALSFRLIEIRAWGRRPGEAARFCANAGRRLRIQCRPARTIEECVSGADLIVTLTPSRQPLVMRKWVSPGAHINAVGADAPGKQELDPQILRDALVVVDEPTQSIHGGEINVPIAKKQFSPSQVHATIGEVLLGRKPGRTSPDQLTVFDSTGLATHDIALAHEAYRLALNSRLGKSIKLF